MSLFREDERFTDLGLEVNEEFMSHLFEVFNKYGGKASIRELASMAHLAVHEVECDLILGINAMARVENDITE